jgi:hypothetical protein
MTTRTSNRGFRSDSSIWDLFFSSNGDFRADESGSLETTQGYDQRALVQAIVKRLQSTQYDWPVQIQIGANIGSFLGQPNTRETAAAMKSAIVSELTRGGLVAASALTVQIVPVSISGILIVIIVRTDDPSQPIVVQFTYDLRDNKLVPRNL